MKRIKIEYEVLCDDKDVNSISTNVNMYLDEAIRKICPNIKDTVCIEFSCLGDVK